MTREQMLEAVADYERRIAALEEDSKPVREQLGNLDRTKGRLRQEKAELEAKLREVDRKPRVSDHAVIRYLERKHGFDFEKVRSSLLTPQVFEAIQQGAAGVKIEGGTLKIRDKTITTFIA